MHFVMYAFSNHVEILHNVTPIDLLAQSAVLSDGVVVKVLNTVTLIDLLAQSAVLFFNSLMLAPLRCMKYFFNSPTFLLK